MIYQYSRTGTYHIQNGQNNQDVILTKETKRFSAAVLADGVSSCSKAAEGAAIAAKALIELLMDSGEFFFGFDSKKTTDFILSRVLFELNKTAQKSGNDAAEYSSTLCSVIFDKTTRKLLYFSLGDSMITATGSKGFEILAAPYEDNGTGCCTTTTENASAAVRTAVINAEEYDSVLLLSDGAWANLFCKGSLSGNVRDMIVRQDMPALAAYIENLGGQDDNSFIAMELTPGISKITEL